MRLLIPGTVLCLLTTITAVIPAPLNDGPRSLPAEVTTPARIEIEGISPGSLVIQGGGDTPKEINEAFLTLAGKEKTRLVIIPTASADAEKPTGWTERWKAMNLADVTMLHTRDRKRANTEEFVKPLKEATAVWIAGGDQQRLSDAYAGTLVEKELQALLKRGGVIWGTSAGAAIQSRLMIAGGKPPVAELSRGFDLLPGTVIDQHFVVRQREPRLRSVLQKHPGFIGIGVDEGTALIVKGRSLRAIGKSTVTILIPEGAGRSLRKIELKDKQVSDLTMLRKSALARTQPPFPSVQVRTPEVPVGSLLIVGGGGMPAEVTSRFIELAGGKDKTFVVLPVSNPDPIPATSGNFLKRAGISKVHVLPGRTRDEVTKPEVLALLDHADAVWFDGGRQWRFVDAYEGTPFYDKLHGVLKRGGVIGGSSAGATIQGEYLCRGNPLGPNDMLCEGYEKGFCFLPGVGIDQHFTQRNRFADMVLFKKTYPQFLGIGIDEATALVVKGHVAEVIGKTRACFYTKVPADAQDFVNVKSGETFDFKTMMKVEK